MFSKTLIAVSAFAAVAVASPWYTPEPSKGTATVTTTVTVTQTAPATSTEPASQCSSGSVQCCNSVTTAGSPGASAILALLGIVVPDANVPVGLTCSGISGVGVGGTNCQSNTLCCENNDFNALISIGCVPVNIAL